MDKKCVCSTVLVVVLIGVLGVSINVHKVEASGTIYILATGEVVGTDKIYWDGDTYYEFTGNIIADSLVVERSNIIIDGDGRALQRSVLGGSGFNLTGVSNVTIHETEISGFFRGILLEDSSDNTIKLNSIRDNYIGASFFNSSNNAILGNNVTKNEYGVGIELSNSSNNSISRNNITENYGAGICMDASSDNNIIIGNNVTNNYDGIDVMKSSSNTITGNIIANNRWGIWLYNQSSNNIVTGNNVTNNLVDGVLLQSSASNNTVSVNNLLNNNYSGIWLYDASNNTIKGNNVTANNPYGIYIEVNSSDNTIFHNNFINNGEQAHINQSDIRNVWDDGVEGNYWSNYTGADSNHDGIGETAHVIGENNTDHYPLMGLFSSFNTTLGNHVNVVSNSTIESFGYFEYHGIIKMYVSNMTADQTFGFCRVAIPHALMDVRNITVIIDDNLTEVLYFNDTIHGNGTHRWICFVYQHTTHEVVIVPEFPSLIILPLIMTLTMLAAAAYRKKLD